MNETTRKLLKALARGIIDRDECFAALIAAGVSHDEAEQLTADEADLDLTTDVTF